MTDYRGSLVWGRGNDRKQQWYGTIKESAHGINSTNKILIYLFETVTAKRYGPNFIRAALT